MRRRVPCRRPPPALVSERATLGLLLGSSPKAKMGAQRPTTVRSSKFEVVSSAAEGGGKRAREVSNLRPSA